MVPAGVVKLTDCRLFSAFLDQAKPLKLRKTAIDYLPRFGSESAPIRRASTSLTNGLALRQGHLGFAQHADNLFRGVAFTAHFVLLSRGQNAPNSLNKCGPLLGGHSTIEGNLHFAFRFVLCPRARFVGNETLGLLPWTPPGATAEYPPLSFAENITQQLIRMDIEGGRLDVTFVPCDPNGLLRKEALEMKGCVSLLFQGQ